jgi:hypothetical protein
MSFEEAFQHRNRGEEVVTQSHQQVDVVQVFRTPEAVSEVVARVHRGEHFAAVGTDEAELAVAAFRRWGVLLT